ncbi:MAG: hypothetical protein FJW40_21605 [Acidobacteria bacterium]|nr:hypothetical protein [Acidobacteriota bacterium]
MTRLAPFLVLVLPLAASEITTGFTFSRVEFAYPGASSPAGYGQFSADFAALAAAGHTMGFLNVATDRGWVVQNLPVDASSGLPGLSVLFDAGSSGFTSAHVDFSSGPTQNFAPATPGQAYQFAPAPVLFNGQGQEDPVTEVGPPPEAGNAALFAGLGFRFIWQPGHTTLEEAENQCAPGTIARNLTYLHNRYGTKLPLPNNPGTGAANTQNSLVAALDKAWIKPDGTPAGGRGAGEGSKFLQTFNGTLNYIAGNKLSLSMTHHRIVPELTQIDKGDFTATQGGVSRDRTDTDTLAWLIAELDRGSALGLNYANRHIATVRGGGVILGRHFVILQDDNKQGAAGGVSWFDGGLSFTWLDWKDDGFPVLSASSLPKLSKLNGVNMLIALNTPEPATWLTIAFGAILCVLRRRS